METIVETAGDTPTPWPKGTVTIQQIHWALLASVWGKYTRVFKTLLANLLTVASQGHSAELLG